MRTLHLSAEHFKDTDEGREYCGPEDLSDFDGHVEIDAGLGVVVFGAIRISGFLSAGAGTGIEAGEGIEAGTGIEAGGGIDAGGGIKAGGGIGCGGVLKFNYRLFAGTSPYVSDPDSTVRCKRLEGGTLAYGELIEGGK
ncbi:MAG: hypothetical protein WC977_11845 [Anaerovoracaceae bacterium]